jgi:ABC-type uncharacterized transport system permease subunit
MTILGYSGFGWLPSLLYLLLIIVLGYRDQKRPETPLFVGLVQTLILIVLIIHGVLLHDSIFNGDTFVFGFAQDLSLMAWVGLSFYWIQSFFLPISSLRLMAISMAMFCAILPDLFPGSVISQRAVADPWFKAHFMVATFAVGFFSLAAMQAVLMNFQDRALRKGMVNGLNGSPKWTETLPPLLTMESFLFRLLYVGYVLLTLTVFSGLFFSQELFGKPLVFDHKTVFALISWFLFTGLVVARLRVGLRGPSAVRWVLGGFLALLLTYAGTRFVSEVILQRT